MHNEAKALLLTCQRPLFITGAGLSADSGLPTYRGVGGLYENQNTDEGFPIELALSRTMFESRPDISWKYLWQIFEAIRKARPNHGHEILADIEHHKPGAWILTQNIDGYHRAAGSRNLIELHGRHDLLTCTKCNHTPDYNALLQSLGDSTPDLPLTCEKCSGVLRPAVVLFGEKLPEPAIRQLNDVLYRHSPDLVMLIGTTGRFPYIEMPVHLARTRGIRTIEINPAETDLSCQIDLHLRGRAAETLASLWLDETPHS